MLTDKFNSSYQCMSTTIEKLYGRKASLASALLKLKKKIDLVEPTPLIDQSVLGMHAT